MHSSTDEPFSRSEKWRLVSGKSLINIRLGGVFSRDGRSSPRRRLSAAFSGGERALDAAATAAALPLKIYGDNLADKIISHVAYTQYYSTWGEHSRLG